MKVIDYRWRESNWSLPERLTVDQWAERTVILPRAVASEPGLISLDRTPYLREILGAITDPQVEEITLQFSTQVGKTTICLLALLYHLDQDPWPCLYVGPREDDALSINTDRLQKIILESPNLRRHIHDQFHELTREAIRANGVSIHFAGANSPAGLAMRAVAVLVLDETDKYPPFAGREADPIALARERTRTFLNRKIFKVSTPTTEHGYIHQEFLAGDRRRYWVPCPHCGVYQRLEMGSRDVGSAGIHWPVGERDPERIIDLRAAWYECGGCHQRISDEAKAGMLKRGRWVPEEQHILPDGSLSGTAPSRRRLSYHLSALYSPWLTWSRIAAEFLRSKDYPRLLMNFRNSWQAEVWEETVEELHDAHLRARSGGYSTGTVPPEAHLLTAGVDVQLDHLWYVIRAWGVRGESWLIRCGRVENWEALRWVLYESHYLAAGTQDLVPMSQVLIDAGYRADEVFGFCRWTGSQAVRGESRATRGCTVTRHQHADGTVSPLVLIDVDYYKAKLHRLIRTRDGDPGAWHLPDDVSEEYYRHLVAEQRVRHTDKKSGRTRFLWKVLSSGAANHLLDCEVYALAAAELLQVEYRFQHTPQRGAKTNEALQTETASPRAAESARRPRVSRIGSTFFGRNPYQRSRNTSKTRAYFTRIAVQDLQESQYEGRKNLSREYSQTPVHGLQGHLDHRRSA